MDSSFVTWGAMAVAVFWAVGAYNRLVRLRSEVNGAFAALDAELGRQVQLVHACLPPEEVQAASSFDGASAFWAGLHGAAAQLQAALAHARARPLDPERVAALDAAQDVLAMAWERAEREDAHDLAGSRFPENLIHERRQMMRVAHTALLHFNQAMEAYNEAIAQFPAVLLAWVFGFRPGRGLRVRS